jgi:hypothetical protein
MSEFQVSTLSGKIYIYCSKSLFRIGFRFIYHKLSSPVNQEPGQEVLPLSTPESKSGGSYKPGHPLISTDNFKCLKSDSVNYKNQRIHVLGTRTKSFSSCAFTSG